MRPCIATIHHQIPPFSSQFLPKYYSWEQLKILKLFIKIRYGLSEPIKTYDEVK
jgi:hypothetical protein